MTDLDPLDRDALERALAIVLRDPEWAEQVQEKLDENGWRDAAETACFHCQIESLELKPTQLPPMYANEDNLDHYDERDRQAARLLRKMRMAGLSRYEPNPKAALAKAKRKNGR